MQRRLGINPGKAIEVMLICYPIALGFFKPFVVDVCADEPFHPVPVADTPGLRPDMNEPVHVPTEGAAVFDTNNSTARPKLDDVAHALPLRVELALDDAIEGPAMPDGPKGSFDFR